MYAPAFNRTCENCPAPGKYQNRNDPQQYSCKTCPLGFEFLAPNISCRQCAAGFFRNFSLNKCHACPRGFVQMKGGMSNCTKCMPGGYTPSSGQTNCLECHVEMVGLDCPNQCSPGEFNSTTGCAECPTGYFSLRVNMNQCSACPKGKYQDEIKMAR